MLLEWPYRTALALYRAGIGIAASRSAKAKLWVDGRKYQDIKSLNIPTGSIWVHCASLGEYEQGRPVIEALQKQYPNKAIVLSFFSPSGYEVLKKRNTYPYLLYLPLDSAKNAKEFIGSIDPSLAIFVKYEYWYYYLQQLHQRNIPTLLVSAIFNNNSIHFKPWGGMHRKMLQWFTHLFVQDQTSADLVNPLAKGKITVAGDTRFDRVLTIKHNPIEIPFIKEYSTNKITLVAGSTWPADEEIVVKQFLKDRGSYKLIIAPHEISEASISRIEQLVSSNHVRYSKVTTAIPDNIDVLIIDSIGKLSHIYKYGQLAYIGGGFGAGIHNTLEAAANGLPVIFGPKYTKFQEAVDLIEAEAAYSINSDTLYSIVLNELLKTEKRQAAGTAASTYVNSRSGATNTVIKYVSSLKLS